MTGVSLSDNSEWEHKAPLLDGGLMKMKVEIVVEATGVAESIVEGQVDMIDVAVLYEKALTAVMEKPGIVDLEVLVFDQAMNSKALSEGQRESDSGATGLEVELEAVSSVG